MDTKGVFSVGISGMGPALSAEGEHIVNTKIEARNHLLDELEKHGLDVEALAHRHHHGYGHNHETIPNDGQGETDIASGDETVDEETVITFILSRQKALDEARSRIRTQERCIEHLEHEIAVQENKILLLREALATLRSKESEAEQQC